MAAGSTTDTNVISDKQVEAINRARDALEKIATDAAGRAWHAPSEMTGQKPYAQNLGRLAGVASMAADNLFDVLNVARSYGVAELTDKQVHNQQNKDEDV